MNTAVLIGNATHGLERIFSELDKYQIGNILNKNLFLRSLALTKNIGKYSMYNQPMLPEVGMAYNVYERLLNRPTDIGTINGLVGYNNGIINDESLISGGGASVNKRFRDGKPVDSKGNPIEVPGEEVYVTNSESALLRGGDIELAEAMRKLHYHIANGKYVTTISETTNKDGEEKTEIYTNTKHLEKKLEKLAATGKNDFYSGETPIEGTTDNVLVNKTVYVSNSDSFNRKADSKESVKENVLNAQKELAKQLNRPSYSNSGNEIPGNVNSWDINDAKNRVYKGLLSVSLKIDDKKINGAWNTKTVDTRFRTADIPSGTTQTLYITNPSHGNHAKKQGGLAALKEATGELQNQQKQSLITKKANITYGAESGTTKGEIISAKYGNEFVDQELNGDGETVTKRFFDDIEVSKDGPKATFYTTNSGSPTKHGGNNALREYAYKHRNEQLAKAQTPYINEKVDVGEREKPDNGLLGYNNGLTDEAQFWGDGDFKLGFKVKNTGEENSLGAVTVYTTNTGDKRGGQAALEETIKTVDDWRYGRPQYIDLNLADPDKSINSQLNDVHVYGETAAAADIKVLTYNETTDETTIGVHPEGSGFVGASDMPKNLPNNTVTTAVGAVVEEDDTGAKSRSSLLTKTNGLFKSDKINSIIGRYYAKEGDGKATKFLSRGRNLLKKDKKPGGEGYDNPYCRVWTVHNQYNRMTDLIRPKLNDDGNDFATIEEIQKNYGPGLRPYDGAKRLSDLSVLQSSGFVNITPKPGKDNAVDPDSVKRCMFSIENLAWKDIQHEDFIRKRQLGGSENDWVGEVGPTLTKEQIGPNGGRIMWFPPYNLKFSEDITTQWNDNTFIGRGEKIYTYVNTERGGNLSFTLLIDHPSIINKWKNAKGSNLTTNYENEQEILRFFAGCDDLNVSGGKTERVQPQEIEDKYKEKYDVKETEEIKVMKAFIFFPNNYSGRYDPKDDYAIKPSSVEMNKTFIDYLMTGGVYSDYGYEMANRGHCLIEPIVGSEQIWYYRVDFSDDDKTLRNEPLHYYAEKDIHDPAWPESPWVRYYKREADGTRTLITGDTAIAYANNGDNTGFTLNNFSYANSYGTHLPDTLTPILPALIDAGLIDDTDEFNKTFYSLLGLYECLHEIPSKSGANFGNLPLYLLLNSNNHSFDERLQKIVVRGYATTHGKAEKNNSLSVNRANTIVEWIKSFRQDLADKIEVGETKVLSVGTNNMDVSSLEAKVRRSVAVEFHYKENLKEKKTEQEKREIVKSEIFKKKNEVLISAATYDDEYTYFKKVESTDSFIRNRITEKVQFFDPAFHSITPEGFNARLTFLQQCTRQGPTVSASDTNSSSKNTGVGNLSFGRAPYCVLRIGDFYNTKILIENISINYDNNGGVQWDLNPEGVGVQPMMADVNIRFKFIGGSDISGPIERLQNAVSYNYYSNASIYDRRADHRGVDDNKNLTPVMYYEAMLENKGENKEEKK